MTFLEPKYSTSNRSYEGIKGENDLKKHLLPAHASREMGTAKKPGPTGAPQTQVL